MDIAIRNVKIAAFASEETTCFEATIYVDGKRAGTVRNDGHGGCNLYHFADRRVEDAFRAHCRSLPPLRDPAFGELPMDADLFIGGLLEEHERQKLHRRWCARATVFRLKSDGPDEFRTMKVPFTPRIREYLVGKCGDDLDYILNERIGSPAAGPVPGK